jgi:hypothetical protein
MMFLETPSEKKNSQDDLPALAYFSKNFTTSRFSKQFAFKTGRSKVTYP